MALSPEDQKYYEDYDEMFATAGWKQLLKELQIEVYQLQADALEAPNWAAVNKLAGRATSWAYLLNFEDICDFARNQKSDDLEVISDQ